MYGPRDDYFSLLEGQIIVTRPRCTFNSTRAPFRPRGLQHTHALAGLTPDVDAHKRCHDRFG